MALVAGFSAVIDLRLLGFSPKIPIKPMERLYPWMWWGFGLNAVTGTSLLMADATTKGTNPDFYVKMVFVFTGIVALKIIRKKVFGDPELGRGSGFGIGQGIGLGLADLLGGSDHRGGACWRMWASVSGLPGLKN